MEETNNSSDSMDTSGSENDSNEIIGDANVVENTALTPKMIKQLKLKIDGAEYDEDLPFEIDENNKEQIEYMKRHLQMSKAASKRMHEASLTRKQAEQFLHVLQNDPMRILENPQIMGEEKFRHIAEEYLSKRLRAEMLSPQERLQMEREEKLRGFEEKEKKAKETQEAEEMAKLESQYADQFEKTIITALQSSSLPKNQFTVKRMAELMQKNITHGLELEPAVLAQLVKEDYQRELVSLIGSSDPAQIISLFGEDLTNKIRKHDLQKLKSSQQQFGVNTQGRPQSQSNEPTKAMSRDEWREHLNKKLKE